MMLPVMTDNLPKLTRIMLEMIPTGKQDAVSMTNLSKMLKLPSSDVRLLILKARIKGVLICSGDAGYYFPENEGELKEYANRRRKYIRTANDALKPFEAILGHQKEGDAE